MSMMHDHLPALLDAGYEVTFTKGPRGYFAHVENDDPDAGCTAAGKTPGEALWAASPLHGDGEPYPGEAIDVFASIVRESDRRRQAHAGDRITALEARMDALMDVLGAALRHAGITA